MTHWSEILNRMVGNLVEGECRTAWLAIWWCRVFGNLVLWLGTWGKVLRFGALIGNMGSSVLKFGTTLLGFWDKVFGTALWAKPLCWHWHSGSVQLTLLVQFTHMYSIFPRFFLVDEQKRHFEMLSIYCNHYASLIPMSFVLGISIALFTSFYTMET